MSAYEILLSDEYQSILAGIGLFPAKTSLFEKVDQSNSIGKAAAEAAANAKLTPASPKWADVESKALLQTAFSRIAAGDDVKTIAEKLDADIEEILNS
jgi:N,N'-diacetylchitobiose transport system substrate-binding protein